MMWIVISLLAFILGFILGLIWGLKRFLGKMYVKASFNGFKGKIMVKPGSVKPIEIITLKTEKELEQEEHDNLWKALYKRGFKK